MLIRWNGKLLRRAAFGGKIANSLACCCTLNCCAELAGADPGRSWLVTFAGYTFDEAALADEFEVPYGPLGGGEIPEGCTWQEDFDVGDPLITVGIRLFYYLSGKIEVQMLLEEAVYTWELDPAECDDMYGPTVLTEVNPPPGSGSCTIEAKPLP